MNAGIALGSNIEPRLENILAAARRIEAFCGPSLASSVYETAPVDCPEGSGAFLNAVLEVQTSLSPEELLERLRQIERDLGRPPVHGFNSPRTIDLDILYCDNLTLDLPQLIVPHPRLGERQFVLQPLADIRPDMVLPTFTKSVKELLADLPKVEEFRPVSGIPCSKEP